jgi:hypothetical protein
MIDPRIIQARQLAADNWAVIPCNGKIPVEPGWQKATIPDEATIASWTGYNIGIALGENSDNGFVIDFDGWTGYNAFKEQFPHYATTYAVATGSGNGCHLYFRPDSTRIIAATATKVFVTDAILEGVSEPRGLAVCIEVFPTAPR